MSGLFTSYVIEPALRQARRFSTSQDQSPQASRPAVLPSHAEAEYLDLAQHDTTRTNSPAATRTHSPSRLAASGERQDATSIQYASNGDDHDNAYTLATRNRNPDASLPLEAIGSMSFESTQSAPVEIAPTHSSNPPHRASQQLRRIPDAPGSRHGSVDLSAARAEDDDATTATNRSRNDSTGSSVMSGALPANDGMMDLRHKVHQIREMALSSEEKAKLMHALMTADYESFKADTAHERHTSNELQAPVGLAQRLRSPSPTSTASVHDPENQYNIDDVDLESTYCPPSPTSDRGDEPDDEPESYELEHGCIHYKRNIKIQCFDCRRWYTCRLCHDEDTTDHHLDRRKIQNMLCMYCKTPQPAAEYCKKCGTLAASYYCDICKLWDNDARRRIYHCDDCGICRRGEGLGKDYVHCKKCNVCISIAYATTHRCVERATECDCPICGDYLFTSSASVVAMKCGHYIHKACYDAYMQTSYRCPICNRSAVNMELQWRKLDRSIEAQPMPEQYQKTKVWITCNDCTGRTCVPYHWLGNKCTECDSYNTNEVKVLDAPATQSEDAPTSHTDEAARSEPAAEVVASPERLTESPSQSSALLNESLPTPDIEPDSAITNDIPTTTSPSMPVLDTTSEPDNTEDADETNEEASFWGEGIALSGPSTWHLPALPLNMPRPAQLFRDRISSAGAGASASLSDDGHANSYTLTLRPRLFNALGTPFVRALSADAVPRPTLADAAAGNRETDEAVLPSRERVGGWGLGPPAWLASRMQAFSRDAEATFFEAGGERAVAVAANPWDWRARFGSAWERAVSDEDDDDDVDDDVDDDEEENEEEEEDEEDEDDAEDAEGTEDVRPGDEEEADDMFGLPGHR